jgi:hypothetical protein
VLAEEKPLLTLLPVLFKAAAAALMAARAKASVLEGVELPKPELIIHNAAAAIPNCALRPARAAALQFRYAQCHGADSIPLTD